jgi:CrcB protein
MLTYLWVALGGALGSVARYWMTNVIVAVTGPLFPWGTIAINVIGSFVIGLVAYATVPVGMVPISLDIRAFVLVGICGGYTTFSSFSIQTLE